MVSWNTYLSNRPLTNFGIALIIVGVQFFSIGGRRNDSKAELRKNKKLLDKRKNCSKRASFCYYE
jgi:hypothetical protein